MTNLNQDLTGSKKSFRKGGIGLLQTLRDLTLCSFQYQFNKDFRAVLRVIYQDMPSLEQDRVSRNRRVGKNEVEQGAEAPTTKQPMDQTMKKILILAAVFGFAAAYTAGAAEALSLIHI